MTKDSLLKHKLTEPAVFFMLTILGSFFNYVFNIVMGRLLRPEEYGEMLSLLSMLVIISVPLSSLQTVITKYVSDFYAHEKINLIKQLLMRILKHLLVFGFICTVFIILIRGFISSYLQLNSTTTVMVLSTVIIPFVIAPIPQAVLQGLQRFYAFGLILAGGGFFRLFFGIIFVLVGLGVSGAILGTTLSSVIMFILTFLVLKDIVFKQQDNKNSSINFLGIYTYAWPALIAQVGIMSLTSIDIIIVKHFFDPVLAGQYAGAQIISKIIFFVSTAVAMMMFPKTAFHHAKEKDPFHYLLISLILVAVISGITVFCYFLMPDFLISTFFGSNYSGSVPLLGWLGISMMLFSLLYILIFYQLSIKQTAFVYTLVPVVLLQIVLLYIFHSNLHQVINVSILCGFLLTFLNILFVVFKRNKYAKS